MEKSLRIGLIGCGQIAQVHARFISANGKHRIVAVCDADRARAAAFAQKFGIANTYGTLADLLEAQHPDVVHIVTPPQSHAPLAIEAMRGGCHVLVEKPMALSVSEADAMIAASAKYGVTLCVNHNQLFDPVVARARRMVADGAVGRVVSVEAYYGFNVGQTGRRGWVDSLPGSVFHNVAPHPISLILPFIGEPTEVNVATLATGTLGPDAPDELRVLLSGRAATGVLTISLAVKPHVNFLKIYGSKGIIYVDLGNMILSVERLRPLPKVVARGLMSIEQGMQIAGGAVGSAIKILSGRVKSYQGLGDLVAAFHASLVQGGDPPVSGEDGRRAVRVWQDIHSKVPVAPPLERVIRAGTRRPTVAVTGASGFLGSHLVEKLSQQGIVARVLVRPTSHIDHLRRLDVELVSTNLTDPEAVKRSLDGCDTVYHCAAATNGNWDDYVEGTIRTTDSVLEAKSRGRRRPVRPRQLSFCLRGHAPQERVPRHRRRPLRAASRAERFLQCLESRIGKARARVRKRTGTANRRPSPGHAVRAARKSVLPTHRLLVEGQSLRHHRPGQEPPPAGLCRERRRRDVPGCNR